MSELSFTPSPDVTHILNHLLDIFERRDGAPKQAVRLRLSDHKAALPGYYSQTDPGPRATCNEQLTNLAQRGYVTLTWEVNQTGHLLDTVTLEPTQTDPLYTLLNRQPLAAQRLRLRNTLLAERTHLAGWRKDAVEYALNQIRDHKSPAPFKLDDMVWNADLLTALMALPDTEMRTETPYRVFSVRVFNDSKRFEPLKDTIARMARRHNPEWHGLSEFEALREMGLVANPSHLHLYGPWQLVDSDGQAMSLAEFYPSVGIPAMLAARLRRVKVAGPRVICVENLASFYELIRHEQADMAAMCLLGNPSPSTRHLLRCLAADLPIDAPLFLWADIDYGGLNILAQLRQTVSARFTPYRMDCATLDAFAHWGQPLTRSDVHNLKRLRHHPVLADMESLIDHMLLREIKLEQEAIVLAQS